MNSPDTALIYTAVPDYRVSVFDQVYKKLDGKFHIYAGSTHFTPGLRLGAIPADRITLLDNQFLLKKKLLIQHKSLAYALRHDVTICEMNPRTISAWYLMMRLRAKRRPVVGWGHAWPRQGRGAKSDKIRGLIRNLSDVVIVYTESQARELQEVMPGKKIVAAPNALFTREQMLAALSEDTEPRTDYIYVGRLSAEKKPLLLVRAFAQALGRLPRESKLWIFGAGPQEQEVASLIKDLDLTDRVAMMGWVSDFESLQPYYKRCVASISPGFVGLSITQSFAFGVPMIISTTEPHAPEIEAAIEGRNCQFFETDAVDSLCKALIAARSSSFDSASEIVKDCAERYSVDHMSDRIVEAAVYAFESRGKN